ncbi:MAG: DNA repair protein RadA [Actinomycetota bacterium]
MVKTALVCRQCGYRSFQWVGRCPGCSAWDSFSEVVPAAKGAGPAPVPINNVDIDSHSVLSTGLAEFDRVLGGEGLVKGSVVLLAGEPGVGKSTLVLQAAAGLELREQRVGLFCGEESLAQVATRAHRLGGPRAAKISPATDVNEIAAALSQFDVAFVDSVQTLFDPEVSGNAGSLAQVRSGAAKLATAAKAANTALVLVGHVTKDGEVAGPRTLEHLVDAVLLFDGDRGHSIRTLRGIKNRYGPTGELGVFEMLPSGLRQVADASELFLQHRQPGIPGSVVACVIEGRRPVAVELQTLVVANNSPAPRRVAQGVELSRLVMMLAILQKWTNVPIKNGDVYAAVAGGLRAAEPGVDLALALAIAGSSMNLRMPSEMAAVGELGLSGDIRPVPGIQNRIKELGRLGFTCVVGPTSASNMPGVEVLGLTRIDLAIDVLEPIPAMSPS